jgi:hypothetical protein
MKLNKSSAEDSPMTGDFMKNEWWAPSFLGPPPEGADWDPVELGNLLEFIVTLVWIEFACAAKITKA